MPEAVLSPHCPFPLDIPCGTAWVSLVAFTMRRFRFAPLGRLGERLLQWPGEQRYLNLRTYVKVHRQPGICFLTEWLSSRAAVWLAAPTYSLPLRHARVCYHHPAAADCGCGEVLDHATGAALRDEYRKAAGLPAPCPAGGLDTFLLERYCAFNQGGRLRRGFAIAHAPWNQVGVELTRWDDFLLPHLVPWWRDYAPALAHYSPGVTDVAIGHPFPPGGAER